MEPVFVRSSPTPNPKAIRLGLSVAVSDGPQTFASAGAAQAHPLARALFAVEGVASVFMMGDFLTVTREASGDWAQIEPRVVKVVQDHFRG